MAESTAALKKIAQVAEERNTLLKTQQQFEIMKIMPNTPMAQQFFLAMQQSILDSMNSTPAPTVSEWTSPQPTQTERQNRFLTEQEMDMQRFNARFARERDGSFHENAPLYAEDTQQSSPITQDIDNLPHTQTDVPLFVPETQYPTPDEQTQIESEHIQVYERESEDAQLDEFEDDDEEESEDLLHY